MSHITPILLNDTLNLIQLARETAKAKGQQNQADKLSPIVENLRTLVNEAREPRATSPASGVFGQSDFRKLLSIANSQDGDKQRVSPTNSSNERNQIVLAMSAGGMNEIDIARQMGMTRDEVQLVLSIHQHQNRLRIE